MRMRGVALAAMLAWVATEAAAAEGLGGDPLRAALRAELTAGPTITVAGVALDTEELQALYQPRAYFPLWVDGGHLAPRATDIVAMLDGADGEGLDRDDYHVDALTALLADFGPEDAAAAELLLSAAVMSYGEDLHVGRLVPRRVDESFDINLKPMDRTHVAVAAAVVPDAPAYLAGMAPRFAGYAALRDALVQYRAIAAAGGWPTVPAGETLRPGQSSDRVVALRARLGSTGEYAGDPADASREYDPNLVEAVERFQERLGLKADGAVGRNTLAALNTTVEERLDQIVATMERMRWLPADLGPRYLMVNVPDFTLAIVDDGAVVRRMDVVVGQPERKTPLFSSALTYLEFNPTWTVPTSIAVRDYLPKLQNDPYYLADHNFTLFSGWGAGSGEMQGEYVDWYSVGSGIRNLRLRQEPGPGNSLGKVKFMMDNNWSVYLHDTPSRNLFARDRRAFSSGCVRLEDPIWLADYLLEGSAEWTPARRERIMGSWWPTTRVNLPGPVPLHIVYQTAWADEAGGVVFRDDIYGIDAKVIRALAERAEATSAQLASAD